MAAWLSEDDKAVETFVILDDCACGWEELSPFYIHTNPHLGNGLEEGHVIRAIAILNGETI